MAKKFFIYWLPALAWMGLIFFLSSFHKLQASPVDWQDLIIRKTSHFLEYAVLFILYNRGLANTARLATKKRLILALVMAIAYAVADEFHQTKVLGRDGRIFDIFIDSLGALASLLFVVKLAKLLPGKLKKIMVND